MHASRPACHWLSSLLHTDHRPHPLVLGLGVRAAVASPLKVDGQQAGQGLVQVARSVLHAQAVVAQHVGHHLHEGLVLPQLHPAEAFCRTLSPCHTTEAQKRFLQGKADPAAPSVARPSWSDSPLVHCQHTAYSGQISRMHGNEKEVRTGPPGLATETIQGSTLSALLAGCGERQLTIPRILHQLVQVGCVVEVRTLAGPVQADRSLIPVCAASRAIRALYRSTEAALIGLLCQSVQTSNQLLASLSLPNPDVVVLSR